MSQTQGGGGAGSSSQWQRSASVNNVRSQKLRALSKLPGSQTRKTTHKPAALFQNTRSGSTIKKAACNKTQVNFNQHGSLSRSRIEELAFRTQEDTQEGTAYHQYESSRQISMNSFADKEGFANGYRQSLEKIKDY